MTFIKPGVIELYTGPMNSRKTAAILDRVDQLIYLKNKNLQRKQNLGYDFIFIKPSNDSRDAEVKSRSRELTIPCMKINPENPQSILEKIYDTKKGQKTKYDLIAIDEAQFFSPGIDDVVLELQKQKRNIVLAGLDLDFRGEPFGMMGKLSLLANEVHKLTAVCEYKNCQLPATRTQRLINSKPAYYTEPIVSIQGSKNVETYESRCLDHHFVPGKPIK